MFLYLLSILLIYAIWKVKGYFSFNEPTNLSKTSTPLINTSINIAFMSQGEMIYRTEFSVTFDEKCVSSTDEIFNYLRKNAALFNGSYVSRFFGLWNYHVCSAKDAEIVLGSSKHINKRNIYNFLHPFLKTGLLTSNGEKWHYRRRMLTPAFHFDILKEYYEVFKEESDKLVLSLRNAVETELNIVPIATQFTLNTICESAMGVKLSDLGNDGIVYRENIYKVGKLLFFRLIRPWLRLDFLYSILGYKKQLDEVLQPVLAFTESIVKQRKETFVVETPVEATTNAADENIYFRTKKRRYAMLDTLLQAERNGLIDNDGIIEETDTFTFEGHDTTSSAITFSLLLLAHQPDSQAKIFNEIREIHGTKNELTIDDLNKLDYLDRVIKECLRIYPPVAFISRELSEDFVHDGFTQPKGSGCNIHIYDIHRDPLVFPDPETFDPDRFLPENCADRSNYAFIAFSAGMRNCIGQRFAMLELKTVLVKIVKNLEIFPVTKREEVVFLGDLVLRARDPIKMKFRLRK